MIVTPQMIPFWRSEEFIPEELHLLDALFAAHHGSCFRDNASSVAVTIAADASHDLTKAIMAGICTLGGNHAPLENTVRFLSLEDPAGHVAALLKRGQKIPGWGGSFQDGAIDPIWEEVDSLIRTYQPAMHDKLQAVTAILNGHGKLIHPNPSAYTACVAIALGMPVQLTPYLFIYGRLSGWSEIAMQQFERRKAG